MRNSYLLQPVLRFLDPDLARSCLGAGVFLNCFGTVFSILSVSSFLSSGEPESSILSMMDWKILNGFKGGAPRILLTSELQSEGRRDHVTSQRWVELSESDIDFARMSR